MFDEIAGGDDRADAIPIEHGYRLASATLLVEMIRADFHVDAVEERAALDALERAFGLSAQETANLMEEARACADEATSLHEFTALINEQLDTDQKTHIVELLWRVAFADGEIDKYEEHLVRKVADLLYVRHGAFIRAKWNAQQNAVR